ncbi:MAG: hypothetical protein ABSD10_02715 [Candidatus Saccharimonadales bacterium]
MRQKPEELSDGDLENVFAGLEADLADPSRIKVVAIDREIASLQHRVEFASETFEQPYIQQEIDLLEAEKAKLLNKGGATNG